MSAARAHDNKCESCGGLDHETSACQDSSGVAVPRAWMLSADSRGRRVRSVPKEAIGYTVMPVRETKPHALSRATVVSGDDEEREARERAVQVAFDKLTDEEREVLRLSELREGVREVEKVVDQFIVCKRCSGTDASCERCAGAGRIDGYAEATQAGWFYRGQVEEGRARFTKNFPGTLTYEEIGARLGLTTRQVHRRVVSAHRKLRATQ